MTGDHGEGIAGAIDDPRPWVQLRFGPRTSDEGTARQDQEANPSLGKRAVLVERDQQEVAGHAALCVYDYLVRVPLIFSAPGLIPEGTKVDTRFGTSTSRRPFSTRWGSTPPDRAPAVADPGHARRGSGICLAITEALQTMLHDEVNRLVGLRTAASSTSPRRRPDGRAELYDSSRTRWSGATSQRSSPACWTSPAPARSLAARRERPEPSEGSADVTRGGGDGPPAPRGVGVSRVVC